MVFEVIYITINSVEKKKRAQKNSDLQMGFKPITFRSLVGRSNRLATGTLVASRSLIGKKITDGISQPQVKSLSDIKLKATRSKNASDWLEMSQCC